MARSTLAMHVAEPSLSWTPILDGDLYTHATTAVAHLARAITRADAETLSAKELSDRALLCAYLGLEETGSESRDRALTFLNVAVDKVSNGRAPQVALFGGLCGFAWTVQHVSRLLNAARADADDPLEEIDAFLLSWLRKCPRWFPYDLISGLVGIGVYWMERLPRASAEEGLRLVLGELESRAERSWGGLTWKTPPEELPPYQRDQCPNGYYNLGVAHGIPAIIVLLADMAAVGHERDRAMALLEPAVAWLLDRCRPPHAVSRFSSWFVPGAEPTDSRLGWCYGDLGIAAMLHRIATRLQQEEWRTYAEELAKRCVQWPRDRNDIVDMGLCHGALGVAHIFNRLFHETRDSVYRDAALEWYETGLAMRKPGIGICGFYTKQLETPPPLVADPTFLGGATGCALALLAATANRPPNWDRLLLLSGV